MLEKLFKLNIFDCYFKCLVGDKHLSRVQKASRYFCFVPWYAYLMYIALSLVSGFFWSPLYGVFISFALLYSWVGLWLDNTTLAWLQIDTVKKIIQAASVLNDLDLSRDELRELSSYLENSEKASKLHKKGYTYREDLESYLLLRDLHNIFDMQVRFHIAGRGKGVDGGIL